MPAGSVTKIAGLYTSPNTLSYNPEGALKEALNCVINFPGVLESRRGFEYVPYRFGSSTSRANALLDFRGTQLVQYDTDKLAFDSGVGFTNYSGSYAPPQPSILRTKSAEAALNMFFTAATGVKVIDDVTLEPQDSGLPRGPAVAFRVNTDLHRFRLGPIPTGAPGDGWFNADAQTAYIAVVGTKDANKNVKLGEASEPFYVYNPADFAIAAGDALTSSGKTRLAVPVPPGSKDMPPGSEVSIVMADTDVHLATGVYAVTTGDFAQAQYIELDNASGTDGLNTVTGQASFGLRNIAVTFAVPSYLTTAQFIRVYRAKQSTGYAVPPNPDYYLVNEIPVTDALLAAGSTTFIDDVPDEALLDPYYNNQNGDGEAADGSPENENARAPLCRDLTTFDHRLWGANLNERQSLTVNLLGVSGGTVFGDSDAGLQVGDTVTVGGVTFTAVEAITGAATLTATQFGLYDTVFFPRLTQADCIAATALSFALTVTLHPTCSVTATYVPDATTLVGSIFFETRTPDGAAFTFSSSRTTAWNPDPTGGLTSIGEAATNAVWFSKQDQPEAVPRLNRISVGERNYKILRIKALGERLFVFTDRGIYTVSNTFPYRVDLVSKTAILVAADTLVDLDDGLFALTTQGFIRVSDAGVSVISVPIEGDVKRLFGEALPQLRQLSQAVGYESYRKYIVSMPTVPGDLTNTQQFVYDVASKTWTRWDLPAAAMIIMPETDTFFVASTLENSISKERKNYDSTDYSDESFSVTVSAAAGKVVTLGSAAGIAAGDLLYQSEFAQGLVTAVDSDAGTVTVSTTVSWTPGQSTLVYRGIHNKVLFSEHFAGLPGHLKHWSEVTFHFRTPGLETPIALFASELGPSEEQVPLTLNGWGEGPWGEFAWAQPVGPKNARCFIPANATRASYLTVGLDVREARGVWSLYGYSPVVRDMSARNSVT